MGNVQTSWDAAPVAGYAGQLADNGEADINDGPALSASAVAGQFLIKDSTDRKVRPLAVGDILVADDDAIALGIATTTGVQNITATTSGNLDGVVSTTVMWPPRNITLTANSSANWDESYILVRGLDWRGAAVEETFTMPDAGNTVLTGSVCFSKITEVVIPAQSGTAGSLKVGTGLKYGPIDRKAAGVLIYEPTREPGAFAQYDTCNVLRAGRIWVLSEATCVKGDPVYVRFGVTGVQTYGAFSPTPDAVNNALLVGARWGSSRTGAGIAVLEMDLS